MVPRWFSTPVNTLLSGPALQTKNNNTMNTVSNYLHTRWFSIPMNALPSGPALQTKNNTMNTVSD